MMTALLKLLTRDGPSGLAVPVTGNFTKSNLLIFFLLLAALPESYGVETGVYHCTPVHSVHYLVQGDGKMSEHYVRNDNVMIIITVDNGRIRIQDERANGRKSIDIVNNFAQGSVIGKSGNRHFYMDTVLHYFYGSMENEGAVAYAEEGRCRRY